MIYSDEPYVVITADTHAGASLDDYRGYLDPKYREDFDGWRNRYRNPSRKHIGGKKTKNWDSAERFADLESDGIVGEVVFPNTVPPFYERGFRQLIWGGGVFERFPKLRFILTEAGCAWAPELLERMDMIHQGIRQGMMGEMDYSKSQALPEPPSFYAKRNCWFGASFPGKAEIEGRHEIGLDRICWGSDYPHYEGSFPYSREAMRLAFCELPEREVRMMLGENAAALYGFDLEALRPAAARVAVLPSAVAQPLDEIPADVTSPNLRKARFERRTPAS